MPAHLLPRSFTQPLSVELLALRLQKVRKRNGRRIRERGSNRFPGKEMRSKACYMHTHSESTYRAVTCNIEWRKPSRPKRGGGLFTWKVWAGVLHLLVGKGKQRPTRPSNQRGAIPAFPILPSPFIGMVSSRALIPEWIGCPHHNGY